MEMQHVLILDLEKKAASYTIEMTSICTPGMFPGLCHKARLLEQLHFTLCRCML